MESNTWKIDQHKLSKPNFFAELNNCRSSTSTGGRKTRKPRKSKKSRKSNKKGKSRKYRK